VRVALISKEEAVSRARRYRLHLARPTLEPGGPLEVLKRESAARQDRVFSARPNYSQKALVRKRSAVTAPSYRPF